MKYSSFNWMWYVATCVWVGIILAAAGWTLNDWQWWAADIPLAVCLVGVRSTR